MCDTVFNDMDDSTVSLLSLMFDKDTTFTLAPLQKQQEDLDCGVFSIAIATSLLLGIILGPYIQSLLRPHLIQCFDNKLMLRFLKTLTNVAFFHFDLQNLLVLINTQFYYNNVQYIVRL